MLREEDGALHGRVDVEDDGGYSQYFNIDEEKEETTHAQDPKKKQYINLVVSGLDRNAEELFRPEGDEVIEATLRVFGERCGLPWLMDEEGCNSENENTPFKFDTLEEAELVAKKANDYSDLWLCSHLEGVDAFLAKHIHEFVAWRPDPVLFLEPGDLLLSVFWRDEMHESTIGTWLIARKAAAAGKQQADANNV